MDDALLAEINRQLEIARAEGPRIVTNITRISRHLHERWPHREAREIAELMRAKWRENHLILMKKDRRTPQASARTATYVGYFNKDLARELHHRR